MSVRMSDLDKVQRLEAARKVQVERLRQVRLKGIGIKLMVPKTAEEKQYSSSVNEHWEHHVPLNPVRLEAARAILVEQFEAEIAALKKQLAELGVELDEAGEA